MAESNVRKLVTEEPVNKVVASGFTIVVGLTNDRQMTFQSGYEGDEDDSSIYARMQRMMKFADRLKATYEIPEIEEELFKHRETLANFIEDKTRADAEHVKNQADRQVQIDTLVSIRDEERKKQIAKMDAEILVLQEMRSERWNLGLERHRKSGRSGSYDPRGKDKVDIDRIDLGIKQAGDARNKDMELWEKAYDQRLVDLSKEMERAEAEKDQHIGNLNISILRYEDAIREREERLALRRSAAEG